MNIKVRIAKKIHGALVKYLQKNNSYDDKIITQPDKKPVFAIHIGASITSGGLMHLEHWLNEFRNAKHEFMIITRNIATYTEIKKKHPNENISLITKPLQIDTLFGHYKSVKAIFYPANTANNTHFLRVYGKKHIFLGHGDSDKSSSMSRLFKSYDKIFVSGQAHIDRFNRADFDITGLKFEIIGRPNLEINKSQTNRIEKIIYIPTWEGFVKEQNYTSTHISEKILLNLRKITDLPIEVKLHPLTGLTNKTNLNLENKIRELNIKNIKVHPKHEQLKSILATKCIYICDISSTVTDCLAKNSPIILFIPNQHTLSHTSKIKADEFCYTFSDPETIAEIVEQILKNDYKITARKTALDYFINIKATQENKFQKILNSIGEK